MCLVQKELFRGNEVMDENFQRKVGLALRAMIAQLQKTHSH